MKCKNCNKPFKPSTFLQKFCFKNQSCIDAAYRYAMDKKAKSKRDWKERKNGLIKALKTKPQLEKELQKIINSIARELDNEQGCISCGNTYRQMHGGHYKSVGSAPSLRFNLLNIHKQCAMCNNHLHGNLLNYREGLMQAYGEQHTKLIEGLQVKYPVIKTTKPKLEAAIMLAKSELKRIKNLEGLDYKERIGVRIECNKNIGIYEL